MVASGSFASSIRGRSTSLTVGSRSSPQSAPARPASPQAAATGGKTHFETGAGERGGRRVSNLPSIERPSWVRGTSPHPRPIPPAQEPAVDLVRPSQGSRRRPGARGSGLRPLLDAAVPARRIQSGAGICAGAGERPQSALAGRLRPSRFSRGERQTLRLHAAGAGRGPAPVGRTWDRLCDPKIAPARVGARALGPSRPGGLRSWVPEDSADVARQAGKGAGPTAGARSRATSSCP